MKDMISLSANSSRHLVLLTVVLGTLVLVLLQAPIHQDPGYHHFVDTRTIFGIPNFYNVISNLPFVLVGVYGIRFCSHATPSAVRNAWYCFFGGIAMVGFASAYYHLNPDSPRLVWDRLPMTIGFMGLVAALLGELVALKLAKHGLLPLILVGLASVSVWQWFGDLRFYVWVQFMPLLLIPAMLALYRSSYTHSYLLVLALMLYVLAKMMEVFDAQIFLLLNDEMGGHAIKHVLAALATAIILWMLQIRNNKPK